MFTKFIKTNLLKLLCICKQFLRLQACRIRSLHSLQCARLQILIQVSNIKGVAAVPHRLPWTLQNLRPHWDWHPSKLSLHRVWKKRKLFKCNQHNHQPATWQSSTASAKWCWITSESDYFHILFFSPWQLPHDNQQSTKKNWVLNAKPHLLGQSGSDLTKTSEESNLGVHSLPADNQKTEVVFVYTSFNKRYFGFGSFADVSKGPALRGYKDLSLEWKPRRLCRSTVQLCNSEQTRH